MVPVGTDLEEEAAMILIAAGLWLTQPREGFTGRPCPRCHAATLLGEDSHGITRRLEAHPLDPTGELTAVLTHRPTYRLWQPEPAVLTITTRYAPDITTRPADPTATPQRPASREHPGGVTALATHHCDQSLSNHPLQLPALTTAAGFPDNPTY